jgi:hypothetical protein
MTVPGSGSVDPPIGLIFDKSKGMSLGPELVTNGGPFADTTGWYLYNGSTISAVNNAIRLVTTVTSGQTRSSITTVPNTWYKVTFSVGSPSIGTVYSTFGTWFSGEKSLAGTYTYYGLATSTTTTLAIVCTGVNVTVDITSVSIKSIAGNHATQSTDAKRPILSGRYNRLVGTATLATQSVTTIAASYTLRFAGTGSIALSGTATGTLTAGTHTITCTAGTLTLTVTGSVTSADLRTASLPSTLPAYQAVVDANTYDTAGFPYRAVFNGVTQFLKVETLDMTATDAVTIFAGVRKLSDAAIGIIVELSPNIIANSGAFLIHTPRNPSVNEPNFLSAGPVIANIDVSGNTKPAPISMVLCGFADISADV